MIYNSNLLARTDSSIISFLLNYLSTKIKIKTDTWKGINCISSSLNEVSINLIGLIKSFREEDFINSEGLYFINSNVYSITILKLLELKLLNYFNKEYFNIIIEQNNILSNNYKKNLSKLNSCVYVGLTNLNLFEDFGLYQTSDGDFKTTIKIIPVANNYSKSNWHILRRLFLHIDKNLFLEKKITLPFKNYLTFLNYINYQTLPNISFNGINTNLLNLKSNKLFIIKNYSKHILNKKLIKTKTILWIDDFYIGGKDLYSQFSKVMITCSKSLRSIATNFVYKV